MNELVRRYMEDIKKRNLSNNTIDAYLRDIHQFEAFLTDNKTELQSVDKVTIMSYVQMLNRLRKAEASIARSVVALRNFYKFMVREGIIEKTPAIDYDIPKVKRSVPEILTVEEVDVLLAAPDLNTGKGIRDRAMLELMYATGIKISEMLELTVNDINLRLKYMKCRGLKAKERIIPLGDYAVQYLEKYLPCREELNTKKRDLLFFNSHGDKMTRQGFWKILKAYSRKLNIHKDINLYTLRHSFAVHLLENGADMKSVQELLGHADLTATQIYLDITGKNRLVEVYRKAHPRSK
jgi:integrase/recombinase XerD